MVKVSALELEALLASPGLADASSGETGVAWAQRTLLSASHLALAGAAVADSASGGGSGGAEMVATGFAAVLPVLVPALVPGAPETGGSGQDTGWVSADTQKQVAASVLAVARSSAPAFKAAMALLDTETRTLVETSLRNGVAGTRRQTRFGKAAVVGAVGQASGFVSSSSATGGLAAPGGLAARFGSSSSGVGGGVAGGTASSASVSGPSAPGGLLKFSAAKFASAAPPKAEAPKQAAPAFDVASFLSGDDDFLAAARAARAAEKDSDDEDEEGTGARKGEADHEDGAGADGGNEDE